ncbi:hypothetical protein C8R46DRAFT_1047566 [Mycena filopes]|nr:hypothetical protein C8R46DRAFT_1047566 [Mycena filopes]
MLWSSSSQRNSSAREEPCQGPIVRNLVVFARIANIAAGQTQRTVFQDECIEKRRWNIKGIVIESTSTPHTPRTGCLGAQRRRSTDAVTPRRAERLPPVIASPHPHCRAAPRPDAHKRCNPRRRTAAHDTPTRFHHRRRHSPAHIDAHPGPAAFTHARYTNPQRPVPMPSASPSSKLRRRTVDTQTRPRPMIRAEEDAHSAGAPAESTPHCRWYSHLKTSPTAPHVQKRGMRRPDVQLTDETAPPARSGIFTSRWWVGYSSSFKARPDAHKCCHGIPVPAPAIARCRWRLPHTTPPPAPTAQAGAPLAYRSMRTRTRSVRVRVHRARAQRAPPNANAACFRFHTYARVRLARAVKRSSKTENQHICKVTDGARRVDCGTPLGRGEQERADGKQGEERKRPSAIRSTRHNVPDPSRVQARPSASSSSRDASRMHTGAPVRVHAVTRRGSLASQGKPTTSTPTPRRPAPTTPSVEFPGPPSAPHCIPPRKTPHPRMTRAEMRLANARYADCEIWVRAKRRRYPNCAGPMANLCHPRRPTPRPRRRTIENRKQKEGDWGGARGRREQRGRGDEVEVEVENGVGAGGHGYGSRSSTATDTSSASGGTGCGNSLSCRRSGLQTEPPAVPREATYAFAAAPTVNADSTTRAGLQSTPDVRAASASHDGRCGWTTKEQGAEGRMGRGSGGVGEWRSGEEKGE